jgi:hypothetical protein
MRGLYAITSDDFISSDTLLDDVAHALAGGAAVILFHLIHCWMMSPMR